MSVWRTEYEEKRQNSKKQYDRLVIYNHHSNGNHFVNIINPEKCNCFKK